MGGDRFITSPSDYDHRSGPNYASDTDVDLEDGTKKKECGCILEHIYADVDRPFMSYTIDRWDKKSLCVKHAEEKEREIKLKKEEKERKEQLWCEEQQRREEQIEKEKKMTERFLSFEKRIKQQYAEVCEGLPIDLVRDTWKYHKSMNTNPEFKLIKLSQEKPRARYKVCKNRVEWLLEQPMDIFNLNGKESANGVIDAFIEEDCPGEPDKAKIKNQIISGLCKECKGCNGCKECRKKKKKMTGSVGEMACTSRENRILNHNQQHSEREKMPKSPEMKNENLETEDRIKRAKRLQKEFKEKMEREKRERLKKAEKLKKRFKQ